MVHLQIDRTMNKKRLVLIGLVLAAIAAYVVWSQFLKTAPSMKRLEAEYRVNAVDFYTEFEENEEAATLKYQNKIIEIVGEVADIEVSDENKPSISLKTDGFGVVKCTLESDLTSEELNKIQLNSTLVIKGECLGILLDVLVTRSIIVEPS